jgi:signal transduction histidine kinase
MSKMRSLYWKLAAAMLLIVAVSVALTAYLANFTTGREFQSYLRQGTSGYAVGTAEALGEFYARAGSWSGVQDLLPSYLRFAGDRMLVSGSSGSIIADTLGTAVGNQPADLGLSGGTPISASGGNVGILYIVGTASGGRGYMGGRGGGQTPRVTAEQGFLAGINQSLILVGLISGIVALLLGLFLARRIVEPLRKLKVGARRVAEGDLKYRAEVRSKDEIGALAASFNAMASSLEQGEASRRRLNADIAHELRTPLTVIEGTVDGILDGVFEPDSARLSIIKDQTELMTRLIKDLRDLSLMESGQFKLDLKLTDLAELARRRVFHYEAAAAERRVQFDLLFPDALPTVLVDPGRMEQVVSNLLTNALRHSRQGSTITCSITETLDDRPGKVPGHHLEMAISDTGDGIPPDDLPRIFDRFYRVDASRSKQEGGTGLGLAIVKQIVEAHGGKAWAESTLGQGSTFFILIPVVEGPLKSTPP